MKTTPGPWRAVIDMSPEGEPRRAEIVTATGKWIGSVAIREHTLGYVEANARVMAAAPDLLEVARIEHELQMGGFTQATAKRLGTDALDAYLRAGVPGLNHWRRQKREAAIAKAEGRS